MPLTHPLLGTWPTAQACALTRNETGNFLIHRPGLKSTESQQPGQLTFFVMCTNVHTHTSFLFCRGIWEQQTSWHFSMHLLHNHNTITILMGTDNNSIISSLHFPNYPKNVLYSFTASSSHPNPRINRSSFLAFSRYVSFIQKSSIIFVCFLGHWRGSASCLVEGLLFWMRLIVSSWHHLTFP